MTYFDIHTHHPAAHADDWAVMSFDVQTLLLPDGSDIDMQHIDRVMNMTRLSSVGVHPWRPNMSMMQAVRKSAEQLSAAAIGETGLDKVTAKPAHDFALQQDVFVAHAQLAEDLRKPLIVHCVKAWGELLLIRKTIQPSTAWIVHGFRGNGQLAAQLLDAGMYLSFGVKRNREAVQVAWQKRRLLLETDDNATDIRAVYRSVAETLKIAENDLSDEIMSFCGKAIIRI